MYLLLFTLRVIGEKNLRDEWFNRKIQRDAWLVPHLCHPLISLVTMLIGYSRHARTFSIEERENVVSLRTLNGDPVAKIIRCGHSLISEKKKASYMFVPMK